MRRESFGKRLLSMLMALVLIAGLLPAAVFADDTVVLDAAIFCSDLHGSSSELSSVLSAIGTNIDASAIGFNGDTCLNEADLEKLVKEKLNDTSIEDVYSYASSHDGKDGGDIGTNWDYSGKCFENDNYIIYTIRETDMISDTGADEAFTTWYSGLTAAQKAKPIFILSHRPLHARRNDNNGAAGWYTAISAAANSSDIVFFWAHNHTGETSADTNAYYVPNDGSETITVQGGSTVGLNFTYMNAGYMNANGQNPARKPVATTVQITADSLIFQDYTTSGTYTNSSYSHNVTVERKFAPKTVTEQTFYSDDTFAAVTATATGATLTKFTEDTAADALLSFWYGFDISLEGQVEDTDATVTLWLSPEEMSSNNVAVYYYNETTGAYELVSSSAYTISVDEVGVSYITIVDAALGKYIYGTPLTQIPDGAVLTELTVVNNGATKYFKDENSTEILPLDITGLVVTATYSNGTESVDKIIPWNNFVTSADGYALSFDMTVLGYQDVVVTYTYGDVTLTGTYTIWIGNESFPVDDITVTVENPGTTGVTIENVTDNVTAAVGGMLESGYTAYDIVLSYVDDKGLDGGNATVKMPAPDGANVVYYFNDTTGALEKMEDATFAGGYVTFTTNHFSIYVVGETSEADEYTKTLGGTTTEKKTVYVLTSSISSGNSYLIVNGNSTGSCYALANNSGSVAATGVTVKTDSSIGTYIELDDATDELWTTNGSSSTSLKNGSYYLTYSGSRGNYSLNLSTSSATWTYSSNRISIVPNRTTYYLVYDSGWDMSSSSDNVYFYVPTEVTITEDTSTKYEVSASDIEHIYDTDSTTVETETLTYALLANGEEKTFGGEVWTVKVVSDANGIIDTTNSTNETLYFTGNTGTARVRVYYTWTVGETTYKIWDTITVEATAPYYTIDLHKAVYSYTQVDITEFVAGTTYYVKNEDGTYSEVASDATFDSTATYYVLGDVTVGAEITGPVALKGIEAGDTYSVWAVIKEYTSEDPDGKDIGDVDDSRIYWTVSDTSIATIDAHTGVLTFTGNNYGTITVTAIYRDSDGNILCQDSITISVTESLYVVPGDGTDDFPEYPNEGAVRFDKNATAVGNFSETGIAKVELSMTGVPYSTGSEIDVVIMLDMTGSMSTDSMAAAEAAALAFAEMIVINEDDTYNDNRIAVLCFTTKGVTELWSLSAVTADTYADLKTAIESASDQQASGGTPYSTALQECYEVLYAASQAEGYNRQQFCVFVSDGTPTTVTYITNTTTPTTTTTVSFTRDNTTYTQTVPAYSTGSTASTFYGSTSYHEYWSQLMINNGVTVFGVYTSAAAGSSGSGGGSVNDTTEGTNAMTNVATSSDKVYVVEDYTDTSAVTGALTSIAQQIVEAAKDVVVEDKIGNNYSINFSLPSGVTADATDGLSEFYIQILEYNLDSNKNRTGTPTVLENFTFTSGGTLKSHTVGGVACSSCTHVTTTNGVVTAIDGTYFEYLSDSTGEYLTWKADKLTTTELVMEYFAYLDDSAGATNQIPAGTYYTNEYATLTYTNYKGNQVQQEFPIPQMTWNGAQVSYVFYLVNENGQPVNRAGKVVPFAEAVYVTDVYTYSVIWNDLEQSAGLYANYLAQSLVPDVYALYDDDASYLIHVYEDEGEVNLNNHFVIGGDVGDEYNSTKPNANTTYVFNTKADAVKYYAYGAYIASDGSDTTTSKTYLCKGDGEITGVVFTSQGAIDQSTFNNGSAYYAYDGEKYVHASEYVEGTEYFLLTAASYTAASGETQWAPGASDSYTGGTKIGNYVYYVDENGDVYTIVTKSDGTEVRDGFDFSNTTVAFAVVWKPELVEDTVVIDFGLDVVIDVYANDGLASGVVGVRTDAPSNVTMNSGIYTATKATSVSDADGLWTATVESLTSVRFHMNKMGLNAPVTFYYESDVNYYVGSALKSDSMYSSVTVIPATTVYYEDSYVTFTDSGSKDETYGTWTEEGTAISGTQDVDRPGVSQAMSDAYDANNLYGYDSAYDSMSTWSMGSAHKVTVKSGISGMASFSFYGTGFDVISMTDSTCGAIVVNVYDASNALVKSLTVNNYYGYAYVDGEWVTVDSNDPNALYQVPVMKVEGLTYGKYTVKIVANYNSLADVASAGSYTFYLDAIRIYDPTGVASGSTTNNTVSGAYGADGEAFPSYTELRDMVLAAEALEDDGTLEGVVFIDGATTTGAGNTASVSDYTNYGPNNELYLANGQSIAAILNGMANAPASTGYEVVSIQLGIKSVGGTGHVKVYAADGTDALDMDVKTATDMYYDITSMDGKTMIIASSGSAIISLTNIKVTYKVSETTTVSDDDGLAAASYAASTASGPKARTPISTDSNVVTTVTTSVVSLADTTEQTYLLSVNAESVAAALATLVVEEEPEVEEPETPEVEEPEEPEVPETPEEPEEPEVPEEPEAPEKPGKPGNPGNPGNPGKPGKPGKPGRPELEQPQKPGKDHDKKDDKFHKYDSKVNRKHD